MNPESKEHRAIVVGAMAAAGRISAAKEQLALNASLTWKKFHSYILVWASDL